MKSHAEHPINRKWIDEYVKMLSVSMTHRLVEGSHGSIAHTLTIRDGLIQSIEDKSVTVYRLQAATA